MKKFILLSGMIFLLIQSTAFAHTMPRSEMYVGGVGAGCDFRFVKKVYGEPKEKIFWSGEGLRVITYVYSPTFSVTGRTFDGYSIPEEKIIITGFSLKEGSLTMPCGLTVGNSYEDVVQKFGDGVKMNVDSRISYSYAAPNSAVELTFYVNEDNIITEIYEGTEL